MKVARYYKLNMETVKEALEAMDKQLEPMDSVNFVARKRRLPS